MEIPFRQWLAARRLAPALALVLVACGTARFEPRPVAEPSGPLDAASAADLAVHNHPDARRALARLEEAEALSDAARSLLWPAVKVGVAATRTDRPSQAFGSVLDQGEFDPGLDFDDPGARTNLRPEVGAGLVLYDGGRRRAAIALAEAQGAAAEADARAAANAVALAALRGWFAVHAAESAEVLAIARADLAAREAAVAAAEVELGAGRTDDLARFEDAADRAREARARSADDVACARAALAVLVGLGVERELVLAPFEEAASAPVPGLDELLARARSTRPELVAAQSRVAAALARVRQEEAARAPQLALDAFFGFDGADLAVDRPSWLLGANLVADVTAALRAPSRVRAALAELAVAHEDGRAVLHEVELDVHAARLDLLAAERALALAARDVARTAAELDRAEAEARLGAASDLERARASVAASAAATEHELAALRAAAAHLALRHACGELAGALAPPTTPDSQP